MIFHPVSVTLAMTIPTQTSSADEPILFLDSTDDTTIVAYDKGCFWFDLLMTRRSGAFREFGDMVYPLAWSGCQRWSARVVRPNFVWRSDVRPLLSTMALARSVPGENLAIGSLFSNRK